MGTHFLDRPFAPQAIAVFDASERPDAGTCAQAVIDAQEINTKPVLACWMGEQMVETANKFFSLHYLLSFPSPESSIIACGAGRQ